MSKQIAEAVDRQFPHLMLTNTGPTMHEYTRRLKAALEAAGHTVAFVGKTAGDNAKYVPPGFGQKQVLGLDGTTMVTVIGVSHDALYVDGKQVDTANSANYLSAPWYDPDSGKKAIATPAWNEVPRHDWRNHNPPVELDGAIPLPGPVVTPQPPAPPQRELRLPSYGEMGDDAFFEHTVGEMIQEEMGGPGNMNAGSVVWAARAIHGLMERFVKHGDMRDKDAIVKKVRNELRGVLGRPPL